METGETLTIDGHQLECGDKMIIVLCSCWVHRLVDWFIAHFSKKQYSNGIYVVTSIVNSNQVEIDEYQETDCE